jgi:hypothetical protein
MSFSNSETSTEDLFDKFGRCIPTVSNYPVHIETRRYFKFTPPEVTLESAYNNLNQAFNIEEQISFEAFTSKIGLLTAQLENSGQLSSSLNGIAIPFILPKGKVTDIGKSMSGFYLNALQKVYEKHYPNYTFVNHCVDDIAGTLFVSNNSRHDKLLTEMETGAVVGLYFPCLMEYSVPAAKEQIKLLPESCLLAGGFDTCAALIAAPDLLQREDGYPPMLWLSGLETNNAEQGYYFEAYGYNLTFNQRPHFNQAAEYWASGMTILA